MLRLKRKGSKLVLNDYITADLFNCQQFTLKSIDFNEEESSALLTYISQEKTSAARCPDCGGRAYVQSRNTCDLKDMPVFYGITQTVRAEIWPFPEHCAAKPLCLLLSDMKKGDAQN